MYDTFPSLAGKTARNGGGTYCPRYFHARSAWGARLLRFALRMTTVHVSRIHIWENSVHVVAKEGDLKALPREFGVAGARLGERIRAHRQALAQRTVGWALFHELTSPAVVRTSTKPQERALLRVNASPRILPGCSAHRNCRVRASPKLDDPLIIVLSPVLVVYIRSGPHGTTYWLKTSTSKALSPLCPHCNLPGCRATRGEFAISFNGEAMPNVDAGTTEARKYFPVLFAELFHGLSIF